VELRFGALDDFHPDRLYEAVPLFRSLRELRERLSDDATFEGAARELAGGSREEAPVPAAAPTTPAPPAALSASALSSGNLLERMVSDVDGGVREEDELATFLRRIVRPHLTPGHEARQEALIESVDAALAAQMRALLHDPGF